MTREVLGENCAMSLSSVKRSLAVLQEAGLLSISRRKKPGSVEQINHYTVLSHTDAMWDGDYYSEKYSTRTNFFNEEDEEGVPF
jgi:hypothetical protein